MPEQIPFKSFVVMFKSALRDRHMSIAEVTKNMGRSQSYVYHILENYNHKKYIDLKLLKRIGMGFGFSDFQFNNWVTSMSLIHPIAHHAVKKINKRKPKTRHQPKPHHKYENRFRNRLLKEINGMLKELDTDDVKTVRLIVTRFRNSAHHRR